MSVSGLSIGAHFVNEVVAVVSYAEGLIGVDAARCWRSRGGQTVKDCFISNLKDVIVVAVLFSVSCDQSASHCRCSFVVDCLNRVVFCWNEFSGSRSDYNVCGDEDRRISPVLIEEVDRGLFVDLKLKEDIRVLCVVTILNMVHLAVSASLSRDQFSSRELRTCSCFVDITAESHWWGKTSARGCLRFNAKGSAVLQQEAACCRLYNCGFNTGADRRCWVSCLWGSLLVGSKVVAWMCFSGAANCLVAVFTGVVNVRAILDN